MDKYFSKTTRYRNFSLNCMLSFIIKNYHSLPISIMVSSTSV